MSQLPTQPDPAQSARKVELIVAQLDSLPTLPRVASQLLRLTRSDQASIREAIELIKQDQAVTARILSLARRAGSGVRSTATTIDKCVLLLGLEAVRSAALSVKIYEMFDPAAQAKGSAAPAAAAPDPFDLAEFWKHSLAVALACERLATLKRTPGRGDSPTAGLTNSPSPRGEGRGEGTGAGTPGPRTARLAGPPADELFVAGLLHDIGKAALHHCLPKSYAKVIEAAESSHAPLVALERKLIGIDHSVVGKRLGQKWNLPQGVIDAIWLHHSPPGAVPESAARRGFVAVVHLADVLVRELRLGYSGNYNRLLDANTVARSLGIDPDSLEAVRRWLPTELADRAALIGLDQLDSADLYHQALKGANEELAKLNAKLASRSAKISAKAKYFDLLGELSRRLRPASRPMEVAEVIGQLLLPVIGPAGRLPTDYADYADSIKKEKSVKSAESAGNSSAESVGNSGRIVVFSEPPVDSADARTDPLIEGVVLGFPTEGFPTDYADYTDSIKKEKSVKSAESVGNSSAESVGNLSAGNSGEPERFLLAPGEGEIEGLSAARRLGWFDPNQSSAGFALYPLEGHLGWVHSQLATPLPLENCYLMPLLAEGRWVGGVVFSASPDSEFVRSWPARCNELLAVATAGGLALRTAQVAAAADQLAEELAQSAETCARLQDQLIGQRAMASVGLMAAGAGHELNNPLMVISGRSELLAAEESDPNRREALEQIRQNAQRASGIITELMGFAQPPSARPQRIDLPAFCRQLVGPTRQGGIAVEVVDEPDLPPAWADPTQLRDVVQEVLDNAQQAMAAQDSDRRITLTLTRSPLINHRLTLELTVTDTGVGMDPFVLEHATDPFFSARPAGRGRGLGLARARRLIEHNGGALRLESAPGAGTTVRISVPVADESTNP